MLKIVVGGLYASPDLVKKALDPVQRDRKCGVLDIGAGSGIWAMEMAKEFPLADVVGMDLVDPVSANDIPPNCRFEIGDANLDLGRYATAFDVVHMRSVASGIKDFKGALHNVAQTLRPQGVILLVSPAPSIYSEKKESLENQEEGKPVWSAMQALNDATILSTLKRGGATPAMTDDWARWLAEMPLYTNVGESEAWIPMGPWREGMNESERAAAELLRDDALKIISSFKPKLIEGGYDEALIERWSLAAREELNAMEPKLYMRWRFAWATRTPEPWAPL
ncbi:hypothetical protein FRC04_000256 [Tulasnella sp. 424]|nr:hypothetical protein FRC04_000256 [Tulasnella sp. 424]